MMDVASFCESLQTAEGKFRSRLLVVPKFSDYRVICENYGNDFMVVPVSDFVDADGFVPMPARVFALLEERCEVLRGKGKCAIVIGLDAYLLLLDGDQARIAWGFVDETLRGRGIESVVFVLRQAVKEMNEVLNHPSLRTTNAILEIGEGGGGLTSNVTFFDKVFETRMTGTCDSLKRYLKVMEAWGAISESGMRVAVRFNGDQPFGGLSSGVRQIPGTRAFLREMCGFSADLSDAALRWVVAQTETCDVERELLARFFPNGAANVCSNVLVRVLSCAGTTDREVFGYVLRRVAPAESYLTAVLRSETTQGLLEAYVNVRSDLLSGEKAEAFAAERAVAIRQAGVQCAEIQSAVAAFVEATKARSAAVMRPWLHVGLAVEETEWMRRALSGENAEDRRTAQRESELLSAYCGARTDSAWTELDDYFARYRRCKCADEVTETFCEEARTRKVPANVPSRAVRLGAFREREDVAVLVVDALGAEYLPFLLARAARRRLCVEGAAEYVHVNLPTSTPFNDVSKEWGEASRYEKFDGFDAALHEPSATVAEGLARELRVVDREVLSRVEGLLAKSARVIVTADHGATRLAVVARERGLSRDLPLDASAAVVEDWRYAQKTAGGVGSSDDLEEPLTGGGRYLVVRGYNRLSKKGAPGFEMHGGATLEERIVPFVVFMRGNDARLAAAAPSCGCALGDEATLRPDVGNGGVEASEGCVQIQEDKDFDI